MQTIKQWGEGDFTPLLFVRDEHSPELSYSSYQGEYADCKQYS